MKILHLADLHLEHAWFDWVASQATEFDLVVVAGDLQNAFSSIGPHDQARAISQWLLGLSTPIVVCSGNHDYWTRDPQYADEYAEAAWLKQLRGKGSILAVDGDAIFFNGCHFLVNGWLQRPPAIDTQLDVLVSHAPPAGSPCARDEGFRDNGDPCVWESLMHPPRLLLSGHIHAPRSHHAYWPPREPTTLLLVPGCDDQSAIPAHWLIDLNAGIATHSSGKAVQIPQRS